MIIDVTQPGGSELFQQAINTFEIPENRRGVPTLVVGDVNLVGMGEIPAQFPDMMPALLAAGGTDWPDFPGLAEALTAIEQPIPTATLIPPTPVPVAAEIADGGNEAVYLAYFYDPTCLECAQVNQQLAHLQRQYPNLVVNQYNLLEEATLNESLCEKYGVPAEKRLLARLSS